MKVLLGCMACAKSIERIVQRVFNSVLDHSEVRW